MSLWKWTSKDVINPEPDNALEKNIQSLIMHYEKELHKLEEEKKKINLQYHDPEDIERHMQWCSCTKNLLDIYIKDLYNALEG